MRRRFRKDGFLGRGWQDLDRIAGVLWPRDGERRRRLVPLTGPVVSGHDGKEGIEGIP